MYRKQQASSLPPIEMPTAPPMNAPQDQLFMNDVEQMQYEMGPRTPRRYIMPNYGMPKSQVAQAPSQQQQQQIPPVPQGVTPGTDDYFAWLESTGLAKTPQDYQRIMRAHESMQAPMSLAPQLPRR